MPTSLPVEQLRAAYAEWSDSGGMVFDRFLALIGDDAAIGSVLDRHSPAPPAAPARGPEGARAFISALTDTCEILQHVTGQMVSQGDTIVWIGQCRLRNRATGAEFDTPLIDVWRFDEAGKVASFYEMSDSLAFVAATTQAVPMQYDTPLAEQSAQPPAL